MHSFPEHVKELGLFYQNDEELKIKLGKLLQGETEHQSYRDDFTVYDWAHQIGFYDALFQAVSSS